MARCPAAVARLLAAIIFATAAAAALERPARRQGGLVNPESALVGPRGEIYVSQIGEFEDGDSSVVRVKADRTLGAITGLNDPKGLTHDGTHLYVTDRDQIWRIDAKGKATVFVERSAFPVVPKIPERHRVRRRRALVCVRQRRQGHGAVRSSRSRPRARSV
ncbi:MAG: hypothetical protein U1E63_01955 [Burkholderiales bacterium]